ncbi:MAG: carotenoid biosynthesis protein [Bacteroidota bacterium]|nr:carotenoid biosynthesis protein [Bacteroidota bacterium]
MTRKKRTSILLIAILHLVGIIGITLGPWRDLVLSLTPFNLLASLIILLWNRDLKRSDLVLLPILYLGGFLSEWIGVQTGLIFGEYWYGEVFGPKVGGTPLLIGVNWLLLLLGSSSWVAPFSSPILRSGVAASLMVLLDILMEPIAMQLGFWDWAGGEVPLQNYVAWWLIAFVLQWILQRCGNNQPEPVSKAFLVIQFLFFGILLLV